MNDSNQPTKFDAVLGGQAPLTDYGAEFLLNCPAVNQLYLLDVSRNQLSDSMIQKLYQLECQVIVEPQNSDYYRYSALYE
ncbi:hypothetical protein NIES4071_48890 [Calothrix sp. NIES-4071]|nr:hypothetical protein NIES4071_48890 [Calothrix sp. NIES-4071]BAZ59201.1 hypothetical protein NIES4105_48830 [Calothrix sp. NIES-4105]